MENSDHNYEFGSNLKRTCIKVNFANLSRDPYLRRKVSNFHPNVRDQIQRHYLQLPNPSSPFTVLRNSTTPA